MKGRKTLVGTIDEAVLAFTAGRDVDLDMRLAELDCIGTAAHVTMLSRMPLDPPVLTGEERVRVVHALVDIIRSIRAGRFRISARDQDVHLAVERLLTRRLGDTGRKVHTGRSRNDQVALDMRMVARYELFGLREETAAVADSLLHLAAGHRDVPMVGRTHLQPAMPGSVALWAAAHAESLLDDLVALHAAEDVNDRCPLGGAAGYGVPLPIDRVLTSKLLGFREPVHTALYAVSARGKCEAMILSATAQVMTSLSRLAEDLILYSMPEFGYFSLPAELCTGSSIMPQKRNPDVLELVRAKAAAVSGALGAVHGVLKALPSGYNRDVQETKGLFMDAVDTTRSSLRMMRLCVEALSVDSAALERAFGPEVFATDRVLEQVAAGVPFRRAYRDVKQNLDRLEHGDAARAALSKQHTGAPGGLDLALLRRRVRKVERAVERSRGTLNNRFSELLGVCYPSLDPGKGRKAKR